MSEKEQTENEQTIDNIQMPPAEPASEPATPEPAAEAEQQAAPAAGKPGQVQLKAVVYQRKWYSPGALPCPQCGAPVNAALASQRGDVTLACSNKKCKFTGSAWGSWGRATQA